jgi:hypothetical protein
MAYRYYFYIISFLILLISYSYFIIDEKNISRKVAEGIIDTMLATGNPSQIKSWSNSGILIIYYY